ncbi:MAG TPA: transposase [Parafilimonas sp.]|nr:transposase [Parafilimonas sp.]
MNTLHRRKFTDDEKRKIVDEALVRGINVILQEHRLSYSVFSRWKEKFQPVQTDKIKTERKIVQQLNELLVENERLKKIIANLALEVQIKTEMLDRYSHTEKS